MKRFNLLTLLAVIVIAAMVLTACPAGIHRRRSHTCSRDRRAGRAYGRARADRPHLSRRMPEPPPP